MPNWRGRSLDAGWRREAGESGKARAHRRPPHAGVAPIDATSVRTHRLPARPRWRSAVPGVPAIRTAVLPRRRPRRGAFLDAADAAELQVLDHVGRYEIDPRIVVVARPAPLRPELARLVERHLHVELQILADDRVVVVEIGHGGEGSIGTLEEHNDVSPRAGRLAACAAAGSAVSAERRVRGVPLIDRAAEIYEAFDLSSTSGLCAREPWPARGGGVRRLENRTRVAARIRRRGSLAEAGQHGRRSRMRRRICRCCGGVPLP